MLEYPELGMEAVWQIEVRDFPAFIVVDDKWKRLFRRHLGPAPHHRQSPLNDHLGNACLELMLEATLGGFSCFSHESGHLLSVWSRPCGQFPGRDASSPGAMDCWTGSARGAMGTVWRARDQVLARDVAVKEVRLPDLMSDRDRAILRGRTLAGGQGFARS